MMMGQYECHEAHRKRGREDEYADIAVGGTLGFTEHRSKRMQALPLRMWDAPRRWHTPTALPADQQRHSFGQTVPKTSTDLNSDESDTCTFIHGHHVREDRLDQPHPGLPPTVEFHVEPELGPGDEMDMAMDIQQDLHIQAGHLHAGSLQPDPIGALNIAGRMPTPIQPSFAAQFRGGSKHWSGAAGNIMGAPPPQHRDSDASMDHNQDVLPGQVAGSVFDINPDWSHLQNRRLPSPISEAGTEGECSQPGMALDPSAACSHGHPHSAPRASSAMELRGDTSPSAATTLPPPRFATPRVALTGNSSEARGSGSMEVEAASPSPPRKGHTRSRHTLNSWTNQQPGMKKSFSIGYRSDCEKCRLKVPGHFNHIIIS